ncbi:hypothetical protein [Nostoc sp. CHAB 5715]|uniref:hypothetical protein n=1 Tax=Nostoc sp. CHAB 5715 TaxID=2780400 RepID=UPI001E63290E|nr:hypothetical protein [Nostoc sp. CHAB 5715]MCC5622709.1 hypothetical protein [Nostoc sp. CHAB 5715]
MVPIVVASILTILLLWFRPVVIPLWAIALAIVFKIIAWISTLTIQVPIQVQLSNDGLSIPLLDRLLVTDLWLRQLPNLANALLFLCMMSLLLKKNVHYYDEKN